MNVLKKTLLACFLAGGLLHEAAAQAAVSGAAAGPLKPALFADLPDSLLLQPAALATLLEQAPNSVAVIRFSPLFSLQGTIVSAARMEQPRLTSVVLKASNRLGAVFTLTRIQENSQKTVYTGRILSRSHADAFELVQAGEALYLVKRSGTDLSEE